MVYCSKCGMLNSDDATVCVKCEASLKAAEAADQHWRHTHHHERDYRRGGGGIAALIIGIIVIVIGTSFLISEVYGVSIPWWPIVVIIVGVWLLLRAVIWRQRYANQ